MGGLMLWRNEGVFGCKRSAKLAPRELMRWRYKAVLGRAHRTAAGHTGQGLTTGREIHRWQSSPEDLRVERRYWWREHIKVFDAARVVAVVLERVPRGGPPTLLGTRLREDVLAVHVVCLGRGERSLHACVLHTTRG
jgi:hypothetical protein